MAHSDAEGVFAKMLRIPTGGNTRVLLRNMMVRHRVAVDSGVDQRMLHDRDVRRRRTMESNAKMAVHRGVGAASGRTSAPELLFGNPLPPCERWGDAVCLTLGGPIGQLEKHETLGFEARPTLPHAASVGYSSRIGPHGAMSTQLRASALPVVSYSDVLQNTVDAQFGKMLVDYGLAVHTSVGLERANQEDSDASTDVCSQQQDGIRYWPPSALQRADTASSVAAVVDALATSVDQHLPKDPTGRMREFDELGTAAVDMYWRLCNEQLERTDLPPLVLSNFRALGVCAYARFSHVLHELHRRSLHLAIIAHTTGRTDLGVALERLAAVLVRCGA